MSLSTIDDQLPVHRRTAMIACLAGFQEECSNYYIFWEGISNENDKEIVLEKKNPTSINRSTRNTGYDAPTIEQLCTWIYSEFKRNPMGFCREALEGSMIDIMEDEIKKKKLLSDGY